jgi:hypothetical protein
MIYGYEKVWYTIQNLITTNEYYADVTHLKPFYYDPTYVTPLNVAVKDSAETIVESILAHNFDDPNNKLWLVRWFGNDPPEDTWETHDNLKDVEAFHHYCATHRLNAFLPRDHPQYSALAARTHRRNRVSYPVEPPAVTPPGPTGQQPATSETPTPFPLMQTVDPRCIISDIAQGFIQNPVDTPTRLPALTVMQEVMQHRVMQRRTAMDVTEDAERDRRRLTPATRKRGRPRKTQAPPPDDA